MLARERAVGAAGQERHRDGRECGSFAGGDAAAVVALPSEGSVAGVGARVAQAEPMKTICAWCQSVVREGTEPATHTICPACTREFFPVPAQPYVSRPVVRMLDADGSRA